TPPQRRKTRRPVVYREIRLAGENTAAATGQRHHGLVAGQPSVFWWLAAEAHLGVLAASVAHLPPPHAGSDLAASGGARASPGDLRTVRRREMGRGGPDIFPGGSEARRMSGHLVATESSDHHFYIAVISKPWRRLV